MLKRVLQIVVRNRVLRRRLPAQFGRRPIYVSPDSALSYARPNWTASFSTLFNAVSKYVAQGDNVWDIGANVGVFTLAAAHQTGGVSQVVAIEADPFLAYLLQKTLNQSFNLDRKTRVLCGAVSDADGVAEFSVASGGRSSSGLTESGHRSTAGGTRYTQCVPTFRLDTLLDYFEHPAIIKVDVEGAEIMVLRGASRIMTAVRPAFYIEVGHQQCSEAAQIFRSHDYRMFDGDACDGRILETCASNTLAVPCESKLTNVDLGTGY